MQPRRQALLSWALTIAFAAFYLSPYLARRIEGRLSTGDENLLALLVLLSMGVSIVVTVRAEHVHRADPCRRVHDLKPGLAPERGRVFEAFALVVVRNFLAELRCVVS